MARTVLLLLTATYLGLGVFCLARPEFAAAGVGLPWADASGRSEFLAVYGGLQLGFGIYFLLGMLRPGLTGPALLAGLCFHAAIVPVRLPSIFMSDASIRPLTYVLASAEVVLALLCLAALLVPQRAVRPVT
jgi:hypothetical protein